MKILITILFFSFNSIVFAQHAAVSYTITIDSADLSRYAVSMHIANAEKDFMLAMAVHPEYDDRFYRYEKNIRVKGKTAATIVRRDSTLWQVTGAGSELDVQYFIQLPAPSNGPRAAWQPFLSAYGGQVGGMQSFIYLVGNTSATVQLTLKIPEGWEAVTALNRGVDKTFTASSAAMLMDAPVIIGKLHTWYFTVDQVQHRIAYLSTKQVLPFDTVTFVNNIRRIVTEAKSLFGKLPYERFDFLLQDNAYGALEHRDCISAGADADEIAEDPKNILSEISHEYFHAWNLVRISPAEWGDISYRTPKLSKILWWCEGATLFYADLLLRRARLPLQDSTRLMHLNTLLKDYYSNAAYQRFSAEEISLAANGPNELLGDYSGSTHLQGELFTVIIDILLRDKTNGKITVDDLMRKIMANYADRKTFNAAAVAAAVRELSGYNPSAFFKDHIYGSKPVDFNKYFKLIGLEMEVSYKPVTDESGKLLPDLEVYLYEASGTPGKRIKVLDGNGAWAAAGIHTGDLITEINGKSFTDDRGFYSQLRSVSVGDTVTVGIQKKEGIQKIKFALKGREEAAVSLRQLPGITARQEKLLREWLSGNN